MDILLSFTIIVSYGIYSRLYIQNMEKAAYFLDEPGKKLKRAMILNRVGSHALLLSVFVITAPLFEEKVYTLIVSIFLLGIIVIGIVKNYIASK